MKMEFKTMIKLKERFLLFSEDGKIFSIYDKDEKKFILRIRPNFDFDFERMKNDLQRINTIGYLLEQDYNKIIYKLLKDYDYIFEEINIEKSKKILEFYNLEDSISFNKFIESAEFDIFDFSDVVFVFHNLTKASLTIIEALLGYNPKKILIFSKDSYVEPTDVVNSKIFNIEQLREKKQDIVKRYFNSSKLEIFQDDMLEKYSFINSQKYIHIVFKGRFSKEKILYINDFVLNKGHMCIFSDINRYKVLFGPLIIPGESACIRCLDNQVSNIDYFIEENYSVVSKVYIYFLLGLILRTLFYISGGRLKYLLEDAQLPINRIFSINKSDLLGEVEYFNKDVNCLCFNL
ncbi:hypothetical protein [Caloranaerobacter azorensis]|nr:hypothetical protein [Caloranaerobacter azorensis]